MKEVKAGQYVRTKTGRIYKLGYYNKEEERWICVTDEDWFPVYESTIVKHSFNIIDLIEVGDLICYWYDDNYIHDWAEQFADKELIEYLKLECNEAIKWVATKEQIENIKYEV